MPAAPANAAFYAAPVDAFFRATDDEVCAWLAGLNFLPRGGFRPARVELGRATLLQAASTS